VGDRGHGISFGEGWYRVRGNRTPDARASLSYHGNQLSHPKRSWNAVAMGELRKGSL